MVLRCFLGGLTLLECDMSYEIISSVLKAPNGEGWKRFDVVA